MIASDVSKFTNLFFQGWLLLQILKYLILIHFLMHISTQQCILLILTIFGLKPPFFEKKMEQLPRIWN